MKRLSLVFFGYALLTTSAYAATFSEREMTDRLNSVEQRLNQLQDAGHGSGGASGGDAGIQVQLDELREQLRAMNGKIEETQFKIKNVEAQLQLQQKDAEFRFKALETAGAPAAAAAPAAAPAASATPATAAPQPTMGGEANAAPTAPAATSAFATSKEHYNYALALMNKAQYKEAGDSFADFVKQYPKDPLAGNVFYWLGETWYVRSDYVKAADSFRQGFEAMPQGNKAPDNLLKLAMSLGQMKQQKQSCVVLAQLLKKFSGPEIVRARATREQEKQACTK